MLKKTLISRYNMLFASKAKINEEKFEWRALERDLDLKCV